MRLMSLNCPNCYGQLKQVEEGKFYCESCGTSFLADYDKDDVEFQRIKTEGEIQRQQLNMQQMGMAASQKRQKEQNKIKTIVIIVVVAFFLLTTIPTVFISLRMQRIAAERSAKQAQEREAAREQERLQKEEQRKQEEQARKQEEEEKRQMLLASYKVTPDDILSDPFFLENAEKTIEGQIEDNTNLFYTNWEFGKPEYITSYILIAKDDNESVHNILASIYKVHWYKVYDDRTDHYIMYDGACLYNISKNTDGTIKADYAPHSLTYNSKIVANQFLSGYTDYDQLIRQEIYGNSEYDYTEFKMKETDGSVDTTETTIADTD